MSETRIRHGRSSMRSASASDSIAYLDAEYAPDYDRMTAQLVEHHRELYASHLAGNRKLLARLQKLASDPRKVVKAVDHALTSRHPKRRYLLDSLSRAQKAFVSLAPTAISDAVLAGVTTSKVDPRQ